MWILLILQNFAPWFSNLWTSNWTTMILFRVSYIDFQPFLQNIVQNQLSLVFLQILMILHKSVCTAQNHQSLLVPLFSIVYTKIGWQFCTHLQSHKVKENVQFYKSYQKRLMILHYAYTFVQNHQSLR